MVAGSRYTGKPAARWNSASRLNSSNTAKRGLGSEELVQAEAIGTQVMFQLGDAIFHVGALGVASPAPGTELRAGMYRCAGREPDRKLISWQVMEKRSFHIPERFALLRLQ